MALTIIMLLFFASILSYIINVQKTPYQKYNIEKEKELEEEET